MSALRIERVHGSNLDLKKALVDADLPTDDIEDEGRMFFRIVFDDDQTVGFAGLEACGGDQLLRSVVVLSGQRGKGVGHAAVSAVMAHVERGHDVYLATTNASPFFEHLGFIEVQRKNLPAGVLATRQLSSLCPSSATIMKLIRPPT
ncbi:arsenic resistance N-acetyltransferase ArsN2 [Ochrobactrum sp. SFR4]|uniref:arsenic resistance N-acetyltransferase ArsN2 n=1 Tax=Ochrobactrum sp. SFR4 TaxID=2717368 RepID=UPI001C8CC905|nr:arsenic resistance N-acetyltransferase ArsN2 [Ochrobactrum sp. SFR4]MBX8827420.1 GNAT family N-acetyltransferase [Ochrobactrum sp. SFR4]